MVYHPGNAGVVSACQDIDWGSVPVVIVPHGTMLHATVGTLDWSIVHRVASGDDKLREEGYYAHLYRTQGGDLYIVDGHHRVAIYAAMGRDMPARVATCAACDRSQTPG